MTFSELAALLPIFWQGMLASLSLFALTLIFSLPLGVIVARGRMSRIPLISMPIAFYLWVMRGTPLLLQLLFIMYFPSTQLGIPLNRSFAAVLAFVINYAAYFAEIFRGGMESIPRGQREAATVLGFSRRQTLFRIILPQVIKRVLPACGNEFMTLVKDTSLASVIGYMELFRIAQTQQQRTNSALTLLVAGVFYLLFNGIVELSFRHAERKLSYYRI